MEPVPLSVDLNSEKLFSKTKNNTGVISVSDSLPVSVTPYFASAFEWYLLEENHAVFFMFCLWFLASLIDINNCPMRYNTKQSIYYSASSLYMFGCQPHPSSGVHKTVTTAFLYWSYFFVQLPPPTNVAQLAWTLWRELDTPVPEAVITVFCNPDDGFGWNPKHVEWTCRIIICVASRWTVTNINQAVVSPP